MVEFNSIELDDERMLASIVFQLHTTTTQRVTMDYSSAENMVQAFTEHGIGATLRSWCYGKLRDRILHEADHDEDERWNSLTPMEQREFLDTNAKSLCFVLEELIDHFELTPLPNQEDPA